MGRPLMLATLAAALVLPGTLLHGASFGCDRTSDGCRIRESAVTYRSAASDKDAQEEAEPAPKAARDLEKALQDLVEELKGVEKDAREKIQKEILPRVREEIRKLREQLRDWEFEEEREEKEPPETRSI